MGLQVEEHLSVARLTRLGHNDYRLVDFYLFMFKTIKTIKILELFNKLLKKKSKKI